MTVILNLKEETMEKIRARAQQEGTTPEELIAHKMEEAFDSSEITGRSFEDASDYVLKKNAELYRRLA